MHPMPSIHKVFIPNCRGWEVCFYMEYLFLYGISWSLPHLKYLLFYYFVLCRYYMQHIAWIFYIDQYFLQVFLFSFNFVHGIIYYIGFQFKVVRPVSLLF